ncbi:MAG: hypothetical protein NVS1B4_12170 [Gemmatimonadaceae bacterium]
MRTHPTLLVVVAPVLQGGVLTLVSGGALALVSAGLGFFAGDVRKRIDDRRRRAAIATALLIELRWLEQNLRALHGHPQAALSTRQLITPVFDQFATDSVLFFRPGTVRGILHFRALVRDIQVSKDVVRPESSSIERAHHYFRMKAGFAALLIPDLKNRLEADGGTLPPGPPLEVVRYPAVPSLGPPAFPELSEPAE